MNRTHTLSLLTCYSAFVVVFVTGCATPLPKPPQLVPMPTPEFLLIPPESNPPKAQPSP
jgi:hypothetical protein